MVSYAAAGIVNKTAANSSYVLSNVLKAGVRKKAVALNNYTSYIYGWQPHKLVNNDVSSTLDVNLYKTGRHFYYWGLGAYDHSYSLKIDSRLQAGAGVAYNFMDKQDAFLNVSNGILYETSKLRVNDSTTERDGTFRNSLRLRYGFRVNNLLSVDATHLWQPSLSTASDYILKSNLNVSLKLSKWLNLTTAASYNKISRTRRENFLVTFGIAAEKYF